MIAAIRNWDPAIMGMAVITLVVIGVTAFIIVDAKINPPPAESMEATRAAKYYISCVKAKDPRYETRFGGGTRYDHTTLASMLREGNVTYESLNQWLEDEGCRPFVRFGR